MKKLELKPLLYIGILVLIQASSYFASKLTPFSSNVLASSLDNKIPFISQFVYFYIGWYLMLFFVPLLLFYKDNDKFSRYIVTTGVCLFIACLFFIFYPSIIIRPEFKVTSLSTFILNIIYVIDNPAINCLPSVHCMLCFIFIYSMFRNKKIKFSTRIFVYIMSILIILSTLFVKQHVLVDVISAFIITLIVYITISITKIDKKIIKKL